MLIIPEEIEAILVHLATGLIHYWSRWFCAFSHPNNLPVYHLYLTPLLLGIFFRNVNVISFWKLQAGSSNQVSSFDCCPPVRCRLVSHLPVLYIEFLISYVMLYSYLYLVTKQWRNTAIWTLVKSVPTQNLMPPPKAMKFLDAPFVSIPCRYHKLPVRASIK